MVRCNAPYDPFPYLVMRFPRYPLDTLLRCLDNSDELWRVFKSEDFKNAILFATPALYERLIRLLSGSDISPSKKLKIESSLVKYLSRMSSRCTPFASLASCGCVKWGLEQNVVPDESRIERYRLDMLYCCVISQKLLKKHAVREQLEFRANSTLYQIGRNVRYISSHSNGQGRLFQIKELPMTSPIRLVLRNTRKYTPFENIVSLMTSNYEMAADDAREYIHHLVDNQILVSSIDPMVTGEDMFKHLSSSIGHIDDSWKDILGELQDCIDQLSSSKPSIKNESKQRRIKQIIDENVVNCNAKYLLQLDLFSRHDKSSMDKRIISQVKQGMDFLCRVNPFYQNSTLETFKHRFVARYQDQEIPLLEALDPDVGVGYFHTQDRASNPLIDDIKLPVKRSTSKSYVLTPLQQILLEKISQNDNSDYHCIHLMDDDVSHLPISYADLPVTMSAMFKVHRYLDRGEFLLGGLYFRGSSAANLLGRFAYGEEKILQLVKQITIKEQELNDDKIVAEIAHIPRSRTGNILYRPYLRDYEINYLANTMIDNNINVNELLVSVKQGRFFLRSLRSKKEILPALTTAHNYSGTDTSPVYRFLCDLQHQQGRSSLVFTWGPLSELKHLPRVMYRNIVFSYERWVLTRDQIPIIKGKVTGQALQHWTSNCGLPRYVFLVSGDNKLLVDTECVISVEAMLSELGNSTLFVFEEFIPCESVTSDRNGHDYMNECIVPLTKNEP